MPRSERLDFLLEAARGVPRDVVLSTLRRFVPVTWPYKAPRRVALEAALSAPRGSRLTPKAVRALARRLRETRVLARRIRRTETGRINWWAAVAELRRRDLEGGL